VDCLDLGLKFQPLGRPFLLEFGHHSVKSSLRTIELSLEEVRPLHQVGTDVSHFALHSKSRRG
jgi:hypothetical protein